MKKINCIELELMPSNSRKSFNGKATVLEGDGLYFLKSYNTIVCSADQNGKVTKYFQPTTKTTFCHLKAFLEQFADIDNAQYKELETDPNRPELLVSI